VLEERYRSRGTQLAQRLKAVIDDTRWIELETVSDEPTGQPKDGLPPEFEEISRIELDGRSEGLRMMRTTGERGAYWAFSPGTVARIDDWYATLPDR
jgi:hypothetical protein